MSLVVVVLLKLTNEMGQRERRAACATSTEHHFDFRTPKPTENSIKVEITFKM